MPIQITASQRKIILFGLLGAAGCLASAIIGELLLLASRSEPSVKKQLAVCLVLDCSGSMEGEKLAEMKSAAQGLVDRRQGSGDLIAVVGFGTKAIVVAPLANQHQPLHEAIGTLYDGGSTNMSAGLLLAAAQLQVSNLPSNILLFTDGMPDSQQDTFKAADQCRTQGTKIIAVATGDADQRYLETLTGDRQLVFTAKAGNFEQAFQQAETEIFGRQLIESSLTKRGLAYGVIRIGTWTALLAAGVALALIVGQTYYLRRELPDRRRLLDSGVAGLTAGLLAGALGQLVFSSTTEGHAVVVFAGRVVGWTILGALVGAGLALFVPNLRLVRGLIGGAGGGIMGALGFLAVGAVLGDVVGRLVGAAIVGFCIGAMIAWIEVFFREAWLEVHYGPKEIRNVTLGNEPVTIGGNPTSCTVYARGAPDVALRYSLSDGRILCQDVPAGQSFTVATGDRRDVGNLSVIVCAARPTRQVGLRDDVTRGKSRPSEPQGEKAGTQPVSVSTGTDFYLCIRGRRLPLSLGTCLTSLEVAGLETKDLNGTVMEVSAHPTDPQVLGLKNQSTRSWSVTMPSGEQKTVESGKSVRLAAGTKIDFGVLKAVIEAS